MSRQPHSLMYAVFPLVESDLLCYLCPQTPAFVFDGGAALVIMWGDSGRERDGDFYSVFSCDHHG